MHNTYVHQHHAMCQNISSMECINQHGNMCIYQYANHVHLPTCQTMYHITHDMSPSWAMYQTNTNFCTNQVIPMVYYHAITIDHQWCTTWSYHQLTNHMSQCVAHIPNASSFPTCKLPIHLQDISHNQGVITSLS